MKRKLFAGLLTSAMMISALTGCGNSEAPAETTKGSEAAQLRVRNRRRRKTEQKVQREIRL